MRHLPSIYILILHWNGYEDTRKCLLSLNNLSYENCTTLVIDNGSSDDSLAKLQKEFPKHRYLSTGKNLGYAGGNNRGIDYALKEKGDYVFLLNNDTTVDKNCLHYLLEATKKYPKGKIFGPKVLRLLSPNIMDHIGGYWDEASCHYLPFAYGQDSGVFLKDVSLDYISGSSIFIDASLFSEIGKLDERFFLLWEESDFCERAKKNGHELWAIPSAVIYHKGSSSFSGKALIEYYWQRNRLLWMEKHVPYPRTKEVRRTVRRSIAKSYRHYLCKTILWKVRSLLSPRKNTEKNKNKLRCLKAACSGIYDYYRREFFGPKTWK